MAFFAGITEDNVVVVVFEVTDESMIDPTTGQIDYQIGIDMLMSMNPPDSTVVEYLLTDINGAVRYRYAPTGGTYSPEYDVFVPEQPWPEFVFTTDGYDWVPPTEAPPLPPPQGECFYQNVWDHDQYVLTGDGWVQVLTCD